MISAPVGGLCVLPPDVHNWGVSPTLLAQIPCHDFSPASGLPPTSDKSLSEPRDSLDSFFSWSSAASPKPRRDEPSTLSCDCSRFCEIEFGRRASSDNVLLIRGCLPHKYDAFLDLKAFHARYNPVRAVRVG